MPTLVSVMSDIAREYGRGLYLLAKEEGAVKDMLAEVRGVAAILEAEPDYIALLGNLSLKREARVALIDTAFSGRATPHLVSFLKLMTERGYAAHVTAAFAAFEALYREDEGIALAEVTSAAPLTEGERAALKERLDRETGKHCELSERVDPSLIGGVRVMVEGRLYDGSVSGKLTRFKRRLKELSK